MTIHLAAIILFFLAVRTWYLFPLSNRGCDAYFFLLCAEEFNKKKQVPVTLPNLYLLEPDEQWYPPAFMLFLGSLPQEWLKKYYGFINHILDLIIAIGLFLLTSWISNVWAGWLAVILYAFDENLLSEYQNLIARPFATLVFFVFITFCFMGGLMNGWWLIAAAITGAILIFTHKLSMQLLWFLLPGLSILRGEWVWALLLIASYGLAFLINPKLFIKIIRAHYDIVSFWNRNWKWLGTNSIKSSPIYGDESLRGFHEGRGLALLKTQLLRIVLGAPWIFIAAAGTLFVPQITALELLILQTIGLTLLWATFTMTIPSLRCLGEGIKYIKFILPLALPLVASYSFNNPWLLILIIPFAYRQIRNGVRAVRFLSSNETQAAILTPDLEQTIATISNVAKARVFCLPLHLSDIVAYHTRKPVLWGTHGYGFKNAEKCFPVLRERISWFVDKYDLTHLLIDTRQINPEVLELEDTARLYQTHGPFCLYEFIKDTPVQGR